jgi:bifunctional non-homologous end joining protein LigD
MGLREYHRKRDFAVTPEPKGTEQKREGRSFCVQKHAATRLHYDFRLEMEGVLKSWAVPKGPSFDPADKRLAMQTEDHPVEYGDFEGIIPEGEYGGGTVVLWDRGTWEPIGDPHQGLRAGALKFRLEGVKLQGRWTLVKIKGRDARDDAKSWLLIKERDDLARPSAQYDVTSARPESVLTGRTLEVVAADRDRVWHSNRPASGEVEGRTARAARVARTKPASPARTRAAAPPAELDRLAGAVPGARKSPLPRTPEAQLATLVDEAPRGDDWVHEMKFDGYRILARVESGQARLLSRNGKDWTAYFPAIAEAVEALPARTVLLDGEVAVVLPSGTTSFQALQNALTAKDQGQLVYFLFDLLHLEGWSLLRAPLLERKTLLQEVLGSAAPGSPLRYSDHVVGSGEEFHRRACTLGVEGILSKRRDAPYEARRSRTWLKVKCLTRQEFVIGGYTDPEGSRVGLGALLIGVHDDEGQLQFAGKVGTGFTSKVLEDLRRRLVALEQPKSPFKQARIPGVTRAHWVRPELVGEVAFTEWTSDGRLRHPSFQGLRADKKPAEVVREKPRPVETLTEPPAKAPAGKAPPSKKKKKKTSASKAKTRAASSPLSTMGAARGKPRSTSKATREPAPPPRPVRGRSREGEALHRSPLSAMGAARGSPVSTMGAARGKRGTRTGGVEHVEGVRLTHPDRVLYPAQGMTKRLLARFYVSIADWIVPHVQGRPLTLVRCPEGVEKPCFYMKHSGVWAPPALRRVGIQEKTKKGEYLVADDLAGLVSLVQMGILEIHTWNAVASQLERPDRVVFDLDPDPSVGWDRVVAAAQALRGRLDALGLESFVKTTGGKGLHVVVPLRPPSTWEESFAFSRAIAEEMERAEPRAFTTAMPKVQRRGRILIDYLRNNRGNTSVAAYSTRARPGAPVSTPITWDELAAGVVPGEFHAGNIRGRLETLEADPWKRYWVARQRITTAVKRKLGL